MRRRQSFRENTDHTNDVRCSLLFIYLHEVIDRNVENRITQIQLINQIKIIQQKQQQANIV